MADDQEEHHELPTIHERAEEVAPPRPKNGLTEFMAAFEQTGPPGLSPEIAKQVTSEHISQILATQDRIPDLQLEDRKGSRRNQLILGSLAAVFVLSLVGILTFSGNPSLTEEVIKGLVYGTLGVIGGYGIGRTRTTN